MHEILETEWNIEDKEESLTDVILEIYQDKSVEFIQINEDIYTTKLLFDALKSVYQMYKKGNGPSIEISVVAVKRLGACGKLREFNVINVAVDDFHFQINPEKERAWSQLIRRGYFPKARERWLTQFRRLSVEDWWYSETFFSHCKVKSADDAYRKHLTKLIDKAQLNFEKKNPDKTWDISCVLVHLETV